MVAYNQFPGMEGATYYYFGFSRNQANLWLVTQHYLKHKSPPTSSRLEASRRPWRWSRP